MPTTKHPLTGVELNLVTIRRKRLTFNEAVTALILRQQGVYYHLIAQMLGTNTHRLGEVFNGKVHPTAWKTALRLMVAT